MQNIYNLDHVSDKDVNSYGERNPPNEIQFYSDCNAIDLEFEEEERHY